MELLTIAELAHKGREPKAPVRFDLEAVLKALQRGDVPGVGK